MTKKKKPEGDSTRAVHSGEREGRPRVSDSITTPIIQSSTFWFRDTQEVIDYQEGRQQSFEYARYGNPTVRVVEQKICALEEAEDCLLSACGMNSVTTMLLALVPAGGHIVTTTDCYKRTREFILKVLPKMGVEATILDPADLAGLERVLKEKEVSLFFSESPTNPYLRVVDIPRIAGLCHDHGAICVIDSTFVTSVNQKVLGLGADLALHSGTKYLAGHNDVLAGALAGNGELVGKVRYLQGILGGVMDPHAAYLLLRGLKTLSVRVERQNATALALARYLEQHRAVEQVYYPGLPSHPDHAVASSQMRGFGGVVSFEIRGDFQATSKFIDALRIPYIAPSLGGVEALVMQPAVMSYWDHSPEERAELGIKDNLIRYACGLEDADDLIRDAEQALERI
jgi:cystathionine gamma-synthase